MAGMSLRLVRSPEAPEDDHHASARGLPDLGDLVVGLDMGVPFRMGARVRWIPNPSSRARLSPAQAVLDRGAQVDPQGPAVPLGEYLKIP